MIDPDNYVFNFGQYVGYGYREVLKIDPHYIQWCWNNLADFRLREEDVQELMNRLAQQ